MIRRLGALILALALAFGAGLPPGTARAAASAAHGDPARQILVLLRLPPEHFRPEAAYGDSYGDGAGAGARHRIASRIAQAHGLKLDTSWPMPLLGVDCYVMTAPDGASPEEVATALARDPEVEWSEPMHLYSGQGAAPAPNDPLFRIQPAGRDWQLAALHEIATGRNVRVAVVDSKVEAGHPDLKGQVQTSQDFVDGRPTQGEEHGTGVAGIIAAVGDNGLGMVGVAPHARLMALRACWQQGPGTVCDTLSLAKALHFAIDHQAQVINLSLSGPSDILLGKLIDVALARGAVVVGAFDADKADGGFPASHAGVVAVSDDPAVAPAGVFVAPGHDIPTTQPGGRWYLVTGSSYAAAHVSGLLALMREHSGAAATGLSLVTLRPGPGSGSGGPIDACASLLRTGKPCAPPRYPAVARQ